MHSLPDGHRTLLHSTYDRHFFAHPDWQIEIIRDRLHFCKPEANPFLQWLIPPCKNGLILALLLTLANRQPPHIFQQPPSTTARSHSTVPAYTITFVKFHPQDLHGLKHQTTNYFLPLCLEPARRPIPASLRRTPWWSRSHKFLHKISRRFAFSVRCTDKSHVSR